MAVKARDPAELFDPLDPLAWHGWCFELMKNNQLLVALPPTIKFADALGLVDNAQYDHAPFDPVFYRLGDNIPTERPLLRLTGQHTYPSDEDALIHAGQIEEAVLIADALHWRGRLVSALNTAFPNTVEVSTGDTFRDTTFTLTLNTTVRVTRALLAGVQK